MRISSVLFIILAFPMPALAGGMVDKAIMYVSSSQAGPGGCGMAPLISSDIRIAEHRMTGVRPDAGSVHPSGALMGVARLEYGFRANVSTELVRDDSGYCVRIKEIRIDAGDTPEIWIHPSIPEGSCRYNVTLDHELEHVANYHDHLVAFYDAVTGALGSMLLSKSYIRVDISSDIPQAESSLQEMVIDQVETLHEISYRQARARDMLMDSPAEYHRISGLCP